MDYTLLVQLAYALGIGVLVGLERSMGSRTKDERPAEPDSVAPEPDGDDGEFLGVSSFALPSLLGFGVALAGDALPALVPVALAGVALLVVATYVRTTQLGAGITTVVAAVATCALGMLCLSDPQAAGVIALLIAVLLASKRFTHATVRKMRRVELTDTRKFLVVILIGLPLLPDRALDPYGAFNPCAEAGCT